MVDNMPAVLDAYLEDIRGFDSRIRLHWRRALVLMFVVTNSSIEGAENFGANCEPSPNETLVLVLTGLFARACWIAMEIHHLLSGGFPLGAYSHMRTLHEIAVVAQALATNDGKPGSEDLAERFRLHRRILEHKNAGTTQSAAIPALECTARSRLKSCTPSRLAPADPTPQVSVDRGEPQGEPQIEQAPRPAGVTTRRWSHDRPRLLGNDATGPDPRGTRMTPPSQNSTPVGASLLSEQQDRYFLLMRRGMNNVQACRAVGISRKTGTRWRLGRTEHKNGHRRTYPPIGTPTIAPISSRYLSESERVRIADLRRLGWTIRAIAADLDRAPSTVSRELNRNTDRSDGPAYLPHHAHRRAAARRARPKPTKLALDAELREFVADKLAKKWSPEQIAHALRAEFPDQPGRHLAIETLYRAIYRPGHSGLQRNSTEALRTGRPRRRPQHHPHRRRARICEPSNMIDQRPAEVDDRTVPGHWEGDLIIGKNGGSAIATLVERTTRFLLLVHLPGSRTAATLRKAIVPALRSIPAHLRRSITWDQGGEMALHREITSITGTPVYFCHPHSPWERGSNENMNGVLRQYFPKSTDLAVHTPERLAEVAAEINERPRKTLNWKTPAEILATLSAATN